ncbi:dazap1, partial [Symbiodinium pilosum]
AQGDGDNRLFVTKIAPFITKEDVAQHFAQFGVTTDVYLPAVPGRPGHKGIAFVSFQDPTAVQLAMGNEPHIINGNEVVVDRAAPRAAKGEAKGEAHLHQPSPPSHSQAQQANNGDRLFVTKVPPTLNRDHLEKYFSQFGELTDCYMP